ncbi:phosphonate C-P lyase system protein PhnG [Devosia aquimaris]|uniref:phosphonate C-P lyase system protein PhnG n=1 Tax=Devosia aquimaris TaxID=2866214 RepID=UPI001CD165AF|nr:phosphonate C-P lyase system protein PhnG [Devosia sp. CJK-A8-3]
MFNEANGGNGQDRPGHAEALNLLARARPEGLKALAEQLLENLGDISVIENRTGLVMVPMRDTVENVDFHLGEVLVSQAHIMDPSGHVGYGMVTGRDLERAMAMAVVDLAMAIDPAAAPISEFLASERDHLARLDDARMRRVEATRVEMETF